jgi:hypothetical protein
MSSRANFDTSSGAFQVAPPTPNRADAAIYSDQRWMKPGFDRSLTFKEMRAVEAGTLTPGDINTPVAGAVIELAAQQPTPPATPEVQQ